jgi:hypothetical protein
VSGRGGTFAAVLATLVAVVALDAALSYVMWGVGFGMKDIEWTPLFPGWVAIGIIAAIVTARLAREHRDAVRRTAILCAVLSVPYLGVAAFFAALACGDGGGCRGMR